MKIEYKFVDGTVTEIEVDGSLAEFMLEMKNEGEKVERKETRRHVLLSAVDPEDRYFDSGRDTPEKVARKDELERLTAAIGRLQPQQRELLRRIYWNGEKQKDIAAEDGVSERAITGRMKKIYAALKKIYGLGGSVFGFPWLICEGRKYMLAKHGVVRQIICTYILHIKCACISDGMDKHSKFLHLFAQLI